MNDWWWTWTLKMPLLNLSGQTVVKLLISIKYKIKIAIKLAWIQNSILLLCEVKMFLDTYDRINCSNLSKHLLCLGNNPPFVPIKNTIFLMNNRVSMVLWNWIPIHQISLFWQYYPVFALLSSHIVWSHNIHYYCKLSVKFQ